MTGESPLGESMRKLSPLLLLTASLAFAVPEEIPERDIRAIAVEFGAARYSRVTGIRPVRQAYYESVETICANVLWQQQSKSSYFFEAAIIDFVRPRTDSRNIIDEGNRL